MRILLSWLKDFINLDEYSITEITQKLTDIGLEVEAVSKIETIRGSLEGLIVGEITSCYKHPNADRLSCTSVNIGEKENVSIVCGAPNVSEGMKCIVALPGTCIHTTKGEDIIIKETKIRGIVSAGMLCAGDEVGINDEHEGIYKLPNEAKAGEKVSSYFDMKNDFIIEVGLTPNRGYALSHMGIARDLAASINVEFIAPKKHQEWAETSAKPNIIIESEYLCKNFTGVLIKNIKIASSPAWLTSRLLQVGIKPKNNVVDVTNYIMLAYGQPMHAYDFNSINGDIHIRQAHKGELFRDLSNKEHVLNGDIVICDENKILSLAGIIGAESSCIKNGTTDVFLESACFDRSKIRLSCQKLELRTEASYRFERGVDPTMQEYCLHAAIDLLCEEQSDIEIVGIKNSQNNKIKGREIKLSFEYINNKIGKVLNKSEIINILHRLDIKTSCMDDNIICLVPLYRENVQYPSDIVEEILRLNGFNNLNIENYSNIVSCSYGKHNEVLEKEKIIREITSVLTSKGFYETISSPLLSTSVENKDAIKIINPSGVNDTLRTEIISSGLQIAKRNINCGSKNLKFFEIGKVYIKDKDEYKEEEHLSIFISGEGEKNWQGKGKASSFFKIKKIVLSILTLLNVNCKKEEREGDKSIIRGKGFQIVEYGSIDINTLQNLGIKQDIFFADINIKNLILNSDRKSKKQFKIINDYPITKRELSFSIDKSEKYEEIIQKLYSCEIEHMIDIKLIDIFTDGNKLGCDKKAYCFSFYFQAKDHTLTEEEINKNTALIIEIMNNTFGAQLRTE